MALKRPIDRFMKYVDITQEGCWPWEGAISAVGYGVLNVNGVVRLAHRLAYEWFEGPIPEGLVLDHLCRNRSCVNPEHLEPVTIVENVRRGVNGGIVTGAKRKSWTHCRHGHEYTEENTAYDKRDGSRICIACRNEANARWRQRHAS